MKSDLEEILWKHGYKEVRGNWWGFWTEDTIDELILKGELY